MTEEIKINKKDSVACNYWKACDYYKQLIRLEQELKWANDEEKYLKDCCIKAGKELEKHSFKWDGKEKNLVVQALQLNQLYEKLEQENERLKKEIESQKGLITVGGKQQYQYLQKIDELEQENKELKEMYRLSCLKCEYKNTKADVDKYRSALEEIRKIAKDLKQTKIPFCTIEEKIQNIINEVL